MGCQTSGSIRGFHCHLRYPSKQDLISKCFTSYSCLAVIHVHAKFRILPSFGNILFHQSRLNLRWSLPGRGQLKSSQQGADIMTTYDSLELPQRLIENVLVSAVPASFRAQDDAPDHQSVQSLSTPLRSILLYILPHSIRPPSSY